MGGDACVVHKVGIFEVQENGIVRGINGVIVGRLSELETLKKTVLELQDFAIWMTGCGYDFCQHEYFCKQRDKLLKDYSHSSSDEIDK